MSNRSEPECLSVTSADVDAILSKAVVASEGAMRGERAGAARKWLDSVEQDELKWLAIARLRRTCLSAGAPAP